MLNQKNSNYEKKQKKQQNNHNTVFYFFMIVSIDVYFDIIMDDILKKGFTIALNI